MVTYGVGFLVVVVVGGGGVWWPMRHNMSGLNLTLQWHLWAPHVHDNSHVGVMFSSSSPLYVPMFISV